jgi:3-deoxy-D-manno-octulosonate 8-phosphate phosphatase (KDO 8-P phosphatase)
LIKQNILKKVKLVAFDFDGVFTDNTVYINDKGIESVRCWRSDGLGLEKLRSLDIDFLIISTEKNDVVRVRSSKLNITCLNSVENKGDVIISVCKERGVKPSEVLFLGNDINDIPALELVGIPMGVADSHPDIFPYIIAKTTIPGGFGAVREVCDLIYKANS